MDRHFEKWKRLIKFLFASIILAAELCAYWILWEGFYNAVMERYLWWKGAALVVAIYGVLLLFFQNAYGGLKIGFVRRGHLIYSQAVAITITNIISYFQNCMMEAKMLNPSGMLLLELVQFVLVVLWAYLFQNLYSYIFPPREMLLVYGDKPAFHLMEKLNERDDKYIISDMIRMDAGIPAIMERARAYGAVVIGDIPSAERNNLIKQCYREDIRSYSVPKLSDILLRASEEIHIFDSPLYLSRNEGLSLDQEFAKRAVDILFSILGILLFSPIFLLAACAIKLQDRGPVFYRQARLTKGGRQFQICKFRTMRVDAEKMTGPVLAGEEDPRITRVGRLLRACRMDELPQFFNILKGDMSLVGPRPERPELATEIEKEIPEFAFRLKVKAGLTGYAQLYGKYNTSSYDKLKLDLTYIRNYSILLDFSLLIQTPKILFMKESTEGVREEQG